MFPKKPGNVLKEAKSDKVPDPVKAPQHLAESCLLADVLLLIGPGYLSHLLHTFLPYMYSTVHIDQFNRQFFQVFWMYDERGAQKIQYISL